VGVVGWVGDWELAFFSFLVCLFVCLLAFLYMIR